MPIEASESQNAFCNRLITAISDVDLPALRAVCTENVLLNVPGARDVDLTKESQGREALCRWAEVVHTLCGKTTFSLHRYFENGCELMAVGLIRIERHPRVFESACAGLVEGQMWVGRAPWIDSVRAVYPYWFTRILSGLPILAGFALFWIGLLTGPRNPVSVTVESAVLNEGTAASLEDEGHNPTGDPHAAPSILSYAFVVAFVAGFCFFVLSFVVLGILPAMQLQAEIRRTAPLAMQPLTVSEEHGRQIYGREGCAYCHTEQVRTITADVQRFGAPTAAWETQYDYPQLWGTRRIGPDLSRENGLRTDDWQYAHLYNPRSTVPDSIMPGYSWMFAESAGKPHSDALDLVATYGL